MLFAFSSGGAAQRYFAVRNESGAKKVAVLTGILSIVGPLVWFVPPMVASYLYESHSMTMVRLDEFWKKMHTPINEKEELGPAIKGLSSFALTGILTIVIGGGTLILYPFNNDTLTWATAGITIAFGIFMWVAGDFAKEKE